MVFPGSGYRNILKMALISVGWRLNCFTFVFSKQMFYFSGSIEP